MTRLRNIYDSIIEVDKIYPDKLSSGVWEYASQIRSIYNCSVEIKTLYLDSKVLKKKVTSIPIPEIPVIQEPPPKKKKKYTDETD